MSGENDPDFIYGQRRFWSVCLLFFQLSMQMYLWWYHCHLFIKAVFFLIVALPWHLLYHCPHPSYHHDHTPFLCLLTVPRRFLCCSSSLVVRQLFHCGVYFINGCSFPASILYKSTAGRYRPVRAADGPITARCRFLKNAYWIISSSFGPSWLWHFLGIGILFLHTR